MITVAMPRTRTHLGVAYRDRLAGGSSDNQERAIRAFEDCLSVWTRQRRLEQWAGRLLTRNGGYAFDCWTPEEGLSRWYTYGRIEDAHYARNVEIRSRNKGSSDQTIACSTVDDFVRLTI